MNIDVYQLWDAIGAVDEKLIYETQEYSEIREKKIKKLIFGLSVAACVALCVLNFGVVKHIILKNVHLKEKNQVQIDKSNSNISSKTGKSNTNKDSPNDLEQSARPSEDEKIEINRGCNYFGAKYGGTIKRVTQKRWLKKFDNDIFNCNSDTKYFFSYSKNNKVLYGELEIKLKDNEIVTVLVGKNAMIDSGYSKLSKTNINGVNMAICAIDGGQNYGAIYRKNHVVYSIEWSDTSVSEIIENLKEVVKTQ